MTPWAHRAAAMLVAIGAIRTLAPVGYVARERAGMPLVLIVLLSDRLRVGKRISRHLGGAGRCPLCETGAERERREVTRPWPMSS